MLEVDYLRQLFAVLKADYALMVEAYFDESGTHRGSPVTCVAGYLFESDQCLRLNDEWKKALDDFGITHFHMTDCAGGGGLFRGRSVVERDDLARKLIGIIKRRARIGVVASVRPEDHASFATAQMIEQGGSYILCLLWCIAGVAAWVHKHSYSGTIAYFFEAGHPLQARANEAMGWLNTRPTMREGCRYNSHSFIGKEQARAIQAADILAWQWYKDWTNRVGPKRRQRRSDLTNLLSLPHMASHLTSEHIGAMITQAGEPKPDYLRRFDFI
ncbi:MAG: DUF3800 domain-containing protein [Bryobacteraceae bacterium]|jgi:hypothetical protein